MSANSPSNWYHSNRYHAQSACEHCGGIMRHSPTCIALNERVRYAYEIVADPSKLTVSDALILHSLGVSWTSKECLGSCKKQ